MGESALLHPAGTFLVNYRPVTIRRYQQEAPPEPGPVPVGNASAYPKLDREAKKTKTTKAPSSKKAKKATATK